MCAENFLFILIRHFLVQGRGDKKLNWEFCRDLVYLFLPHFVTYNVYMNSVLSLVSNIVMLAIELHINIFPLEPYLFRSLSQSTLFVNIALV